MNHLPVQSTTYAYDALDNLTTVTQESQTRTFVYDSLKRLTSSTNPESGAIYYQYDANGNLLVKTDARNVSTHFAYDALNRVIRRWYNSSNSTSSTVNNSPSLPSGVAATAQVSFYYDDAALPAGAPSFTRGYSLGRLVAVTYDGSAGTYRGYDAVGHVVTQYQQTEGVDYLTEATYNPAGAMTSETYPAVDGFSDRRVIGFDYDGAGRLNSLASDGTSYGPAASLSEIGYAANNALTTETYGNRLVHSIAYNNRMQVSEISLGTSNDPTSKLDLTYNYGSTNNGNVRGIGYAGGGLFYTQNFTYDSLNRLSTATETRGSNTSWSQTNGYDRYGNRWIDYGSAGNNLSFSTTTNRITTSGYTYDSVGNLTHDAAHSYGFDAENRIVKYDTTAVKYGYDGEGRRVLKRLTDDNTTFVYGINGEMIGEYEKGTANVKKEYVHGPSLITLEPYPAGSAGVEAQQGQIGLRSDYSKTKYSTGDHLGSPRIITDGNGTLISRHDYMPFGEEIGEGVGGRTTGMGYIANDGQRQKFTQKERDDEIGLNYSVNRYYSSTQGRFASSDPYNIFFEMNRGRDAREQAQLLRAYASEPQNWNHYSYCLDDPVNLIDPSGLIWLTKDNETYIWIEDEDYKKNKEAYEGYSVANGAVTRYQGSSDCPQCQGLKQGDWVQLNENGGIDQVADPTTYVRDSPNSEYVSTTYGIGNFGMGHIVDSNARVYFTFQIAPSWPNLSYSQTTGNGAVSPGIYGQGTIGNYGLIINESINLLHPTSGFSREVGYGSPQASAGIQVVMPACEGTTPENWAYHPDNPNRKGLLWHPVGRNVF